MRKKALRIALLLVATLPFPLQAADLGESRSAAREHLLFSAFSAAATAGQPKPAATFSGLPAGALQGKSAFGKYQLPSPSTSFAVLPQATQAEPTAGFEDVVFMPLDSTGDGKPDGWGGDRDGDGAYDVLLVDADGDGKAEVVLLDNDYNGVVDTKLIPGATLDGKTLDLYGLDIDEDGLYDFVGYDWDQDGVMDELVAA
jgi:hypothetical protein